MNARSVIYSGYNPKQSKGEYWLMKSRFERFSKPELELLIENCNFSEEEEILLKMANVGVSEIQIADKLSVSLSCVTKKKKKIAEKITNFLEGTSYMTTIYVNGKLVTKEELKNYEIKIEHVKNMLAEKLTKTK